MGDRWCWYEVDEDFPAVETYATAEEATAAAVDHFDEEHDEDDPNPRTKHTIIVTRCREVTGVALVARILDPAELFDQLAAGAEYEEVPTIGDELLARKALATALEAWAREHVATTYELIGRGEEVEV